MIVLWSAASDGSGISTKEQVSENVAAPRLIGGAENLLSSTTYSRNPTACS
ncbi:AAEL014131-PA [Aedes aegypti]|uniref:AAEL014131-PA n=1 Tax=Aedes aegypti TaxID=7159 RepID=Q16H76_AEDAE|nr:AAEL014131-PA [Aedes aegypti]